jgi:hypothetical protein
MPLTETKRETEKELINHESKSKIEELKHTITNTAPNTQNTDKTPKPTKRKL